LSFGTARDLRSLVGITFMIYAAGVYPIVGNLAGHSYPHVPTFGMAPCPLTIFTLGMILSLRGTVRWWQNAVVFAWALVGGTAALLLDVPQDFALLLAGPIAVAVLYGTGSRRWH
jgi:hypothetical protein